MYFKEQGLEIDENDLKFVQEKKEKESRDGRGKRIRTPTKKWLTAKQVSFNLEGEGDAEGGKGKAALESPVKLSSGFFGKLKLPRIAASTFPILIIMAKRATLATLCLKIKAKWELSGGLSDTPKDMHVLNFHEKVLGQLERVAMGTYLI